MSTADLFGQALIEFNQACYPKRQLFGLLVRSVRSQVLFSSSHRANRSIDHCTSDLGALLVVTADINFAGIR